MLSTSAATNAYDALRLKRINGRGRRKDHKREHATLLNNLEYQRELDHIRLLFSSRFKWDVSELNVSNEYVEQNLFYNRFMALFKDPTYGWLLLPANPVSFNVYHEPTTLLVQGLDYSREIPYSANSEEVALLYDNRLFISPSTECYRYASLISDVGRSCEIYANSLKNPLNFVTSFDTKKSFQDIYERISENEGYIAYDVSLFPKDTLENPIFHQFTTNHNSQDLKGLDMYRRSLYDELLSRLGIRASSFKKQAQQSEDEINKNDEMCKLVLSQASDCREQAVNKMKEISGLNITCEPVADISVDDFSEVNLNEED